MNTTPVTSTGLSTDTVQTVLLIIVSLVGTWLAVDEIPWRASVDPCLIAAAITAVFVTFLWLTRWSGFRGVNYERYLVAAFLVLMPLVYLTRYLFASTGRSAKFWLWVELLGVLIFVGLSVLGVKRSPWFLAFGIVLHGLAWDSWHYRNSTYIPDWCVIACLAVDLTFGVYVAARVPAYHKASRN